MNREQQMNIFLQNFAQIYIQNPGMEIEEKTFYSNLACYGLSEQEQKDSDISYLFEHWCGRYKDNQDLNVYYTEEQKGFLQFRTSENVGQDHVKLYLSYPKDKMYECVNKIFDFISANKLETFSKVSANLRSDSIVLRMKNFNDAVPIINYINNDPELRNYSKSTNPFSPQHGAVTFAYDNKISFNKTLATLMEQYFIQCRQSGTLSYVSLDHFRNYVSNYYNTTFYSTENITNLISSNDFQDKKKGFESIGHEIANYENVTRLIIMSLDPNMRIGSFRYFYEEVTNPTKKKEKADYYNQVVDNILNNMDELEQTAELEQTVELVQGDPYVIFEQACIATYNKYGNLHLKTAIVNAFFSNFEYFTNTKDEYRTKLSSMNLTLDDIMQFCDYLMGKYSNNSDFANTIQDAKEEYIQKYGGIKR